MSLRADCIEAGVETRLWENDDLEAARAAVGFILDAILDTLEANAEEWDRTAYLQSGFVTSSTLIAALRDTETGPQ